MLRLVGLFFYITKWLLATKWSEEHLLEFGVNKWQRHSHETSAFGVILECIENCAIVKILVTVIGRKILAKIFERLLYRVQNLDRKRGLIVCLF